MKSPYDKKFWKRLGILTILFALGCWFMISVTSCVHAAPEPESSVELNSQVQVMIPKGATDIQIIDRNWCYFDFDGKTFLMGGGRFTDYGGHMMITQIQDKHQ